MLQAYVLYGYEQNTEFAKGQQ